MTANRGFKNSIGPLALLIGATLAGPLAAQEAARVAPSLPQGVIVMGAPQDVEISVSTGAEGEPVVSQTEIKLKQGGYYRVNFICVDAEDDAAGFRFEAPELLANSHLRVVSAGDIEIHLQGLSFRALECDEQGRARFSFHPMRVGEYDFLVRNHEVPPGEVKGRFIVE